MKKSIKFLALVLSFLFMLTAIPFSAVANTEKADSVQNGGKAIYDADDFKAITTGGTYYLANDIDFGGADFKSIISNFSGILDGRGYSLKNFSLTCSASGTVGVFGSASSGGATIIKNLNIGTPENKIQMSLKGTGDDINAGFVAGINASNGDWTNKLIINNVNVYGEAKIISGNKSAVRMGGFVGYARNVSVTNCTMTGSIISEQTNSKQIKTGGIIGTFGKKAYVSYGSVLDGCVNNANISDASTNNYSGAGGIIGVSEQSVLITNCSNNGNISSKKAAGIVAYQKTGSAYVANCTNTGTIAGTEHSKDIVGYTSDFGEAYGPYLYIKNCTPNTQNTEAVAINSLAELQAMADGGIYYLATDLNLNGAEFENYVVDEFGGVLDGNGKSIYNFSIKSNGNADVGFFNGLSYKDGSAKTTLIANLTLGSATQPVKISASSEGKSLGTLTPNAGTNGSKDYLLMFDNVDIYSEIDYNGTHGNIGGFAGKSSMALYKDCNFYGNIRTTGTVSENINAELNVGGFAGNIDAIRSVFYNCNNFGNVQNRVNAQAFNLATRAAGFVAYTSHHPTFINCANFGEITSSAVSGFDKILAAGFVAETTNTTMVGFSECSNFGTVTSGANAAALAAYSLAPSMVYGFANYGTVTGAKESGVFIDAIPTDENVMTELGSIDGAAVNMIPGAAVKLSAPTGLRFRSTVNTKALERLTAVLGEGNYSVAYGTVIAAEAFVQRSAAFTHTELDAYKSENDLDQSKVYVDVKLNNNEWFNGNEGELAGAVVNLDKALYEVNFSGRAYMEISVNGYSFKMYAKNPQTRNISAVAKASLDDVLYLKNGEYFILDGETYVKYEGPDTSDYSETVEAVGEYAKVSPYTAAERACLAEFAGYNEVPDDSGSDETTDTEAPDSGDVTTPGNPSTGDNIPVIFVVAVISAMMFIGASAAVVVIKKRQNN